MDIKTARAEVAAAAIALGATAVAEYRTSKDSEGTEHTSHRLFINGVDVTYHLDLNKRFKRSGLVGWRSSKDVGQPRFTLSVGQYGKKTTLPQKKDGSFSWDKAAENLIGVAQRLKARATADANVQSNNDIAEEFRNEVPSLRWASGFRISPSTVVGHPIRVKIDMEFVATPERAREIREGLIALGLMKVS